MYSMKIRKTFHSEEDQFKCLNYWPTRQNMNKIEGTINQTESAHFGIKYLQRSLLNENGRLYYWFASKEFVFLCVDWTDSKIGFNRNDYCRLSTENMTGQRFDVKSVLQNGYIYSSFKHWNPMRVSFMKYDIHMNSRRLFFCRL